VGERGSNLSGGQRQRIAIARTLLGKPKLLVMDEATSALDYDTERRVCNNLLETMNNSTVLFITHRLSSIRRADRILMMHDGALVESGTHQELMDLKGRYFALYRQQEAS
jgi:ATP-binding cassette subfamily B protein